MSWRHGLWVEEEKAPTHKAVKYLTEPGTVRDSRELERTYEGEQPETKLRRGRSGAKSQQEPENHLKHSGSPSDLKVVW